MTLALHRAHLTVADLVQVLGMAGAQALVAAYGGREAVYIPKIFDATGPLAAAIGAEPALRLIAACGGQALDVPVTLHHGRKKAVVVRELAGAASTARAARAAGCSQRYARVVKAATRDPDADADADQPDLFGSRPL
jgi:hypothetical protein